MYSREPINVNFYNVFLNIPYASESKNQKFDIYYPPVKKDRYPLIVYIHGGAFIEGDKQTSSLRLYLEALKKGYAVASVNYRMSFESVFPGPVLDVRKAVKYIRKNADSLHIDSDHIACAGNSAGGYMVEMLGVAKNADIFTSLENDDTSVHVNCVVSDFGVADFATFYDQHRSNGNGSEDEEKEMSVSSLFLGKNITKLSEKEIRIYSPVTYIHEDMPPILLQHGDQDKDVPYQQSVEFYEKAKHICKNPVEFDILKGASHNSDEFKTDENTERILNFIYRYI